MRRRVVVTGVGHVSSIGFATAVLGPGNHLSVADRTGPLTAGRQVSARHNRDLLAAGLADTGWDNEVSATVLDSLPEWFDDPTFEKILGGLPSDLADGGHPSPIMRSGALHPARS